MGRGKAPGIDALFGGLDPVTVGVEEVPLDQIDAGENPRKSFDDEKLHELAASIREHGVLQPVMVRREGRRYRLVAGERRWRAARLAGLATIPAIVRDLTPEQVMVIALVENLVREDLNDVERAEGLVALKGVLGTWDAVAKATGLSVRSVYRHAKVAELPDDAKALVAQGRVGASTAARLAERLGADAAASAIRAGGGERITRRQVERVLREHDTVSPPQADGSAGDTTSDSDGGANGGTPSASAVPARPAEPGPNVGWILRDSATDISYKATVPRLTDEELRYCLEREERSVGLRLLRAEAKRRGLQVEAKKVGAGDAAQRHWTLLVETLTDLGRARDRLRVMLRTEGASIAECDLGELVGLANGVFDLAKALEAKGASGCTASA